MIRFLDGPAEGVRLSLRNAPESLRVVRAQDGTWDALDAPEDEPRLDEEIFWYRRDSPAGIVFIDGVDPKTRRRRGWAQAVASYRYDQERAK
jgi:hypothetical protein